MSKLAIVGGGFTGTPTALATCTASATKAPPTRLWLDWPALMRWKAVSMAEIPADSSPMKVREEPVTPCTMEMLPASRLENCRPMIVTTGGREMVATSCLPPVTACSRLSSKSLALTMRTL